MRAGAGFGRWALTVAWLVGGAACGRGEAPRVAGAGPRTGETTPGSSGGAGAGAGGAGAGAGGGGGASGSTSPGGGSAGTSGTTVTGQGDCPDLFQRDGFVDYAVDISADEWTKLDYEFRNRATIKAANQDDNPYHPITFHYGAETAAAEIRLKGDSSWDQTVALDGANAKMQFVISFNEVDASAKFHGITKIVLDMPRDDGTFLQERLSFRALAELLGRPAPCANSGRLTLNGQYYGLYSNEEAVNHAYLKRVIPEAPDGDLFKGGWTPETNTASPNLTKLDAFWAAKDIGAMSALVDMQSSVTEWAAEALINDADGYYGGDHNFYLYDYPGLGYRWLICDADSSFDYFGSADHHPIYWWIPPRHDPIGPAQHYMIVMKDPTWRGHYVDAIRTLLPRWDIAKLQGWIDAWSAQIADAVNADPHKAVTGDEHVRAIAGMRSVVADRAAYLTRFLGCEDGTGDTTDADGDGYAWCNDCNDANAAQSPGATEICGNGVDDDCNGYADTADGCP
jgi:hypothetical protein